MANRQDVIQVCIARRGFKEGRKVAQFIIEWEIAAREHGRAISADEFAVFWKDTRSVVFQRLARFREAFPELGEHGKPDVLMGNLDGAKHRMYDPDSPGNILARRRLATS